jgi:hypothetical protein
VIRFYGAMIIVASLTACPKPSPKNEGNGTNTVSTTDAEPGKYTIEQITDADGTIIQMQQSAKGAPSTLGCADGQREAFVNWSEYPNIAGCAAKWPGLMDMRAATTGKSCGDDASECASPADACAPGWHVCGNTGAIADVKQVSPEQCGKAGGGRFVSAISHCKTQEGCVYDSNTYECFDDGWCSESVCCGDNCGDLGECPSGVWPNQTHIAIGTDQGCGKMSSERAGGVLCCK